MKKDRNTFNIHIKKSNIKLHFISFYQEFLQKKKLSFRQKEVTQKVSSRHFLIETVKYSWATPLSLSVISATMITNSDKYI